MILQDIEVKRLEQIETDLTFIKELLTQKSKQSLSNEWIESKEIPKILKISLKTWQNYRDRGVIPFSQFASKIYVKRGDIEAFLEKHYIKRS